MNHKNTPFKLGDRVRCPNCGSIFTWVKMTRSEPMTIARKLKARPDVKPEVKPVVAAQPQAESKPAKKQKKAKAKAKGA